MRRKTLESRDIISLFKEKDIMTIEELIQKTTRSRDTIFRRLREHGYHNSYNKNGKYYTLPEIAIFDGEGFWKVEDVCFSKFGSIRDTVKSLVENSEKGYTAEEISTKLGTRVNNHLKGFVQGGILVRRKYSDSYAYFSTNKRKQKSQVERREQHIMTKGIIEFEGCTGVQEFSDMKMMQTLPTEKLKSLEKRHEMILAHEKFGMKIGDVVGIYDISIGSYYYWKNRYQEDGFLGLINKKRGAQMPHNKTPEEFENKIGEIASNNKELDANDIHNILCEQYEFTGVAETIRRILSRYGLNRPKGRRTKKTKKMKKETIQSMKMKQ